MKKILLFIPMYNCEKQIVRVLDQINQKNEKYLSEIIVVNNRSTDNSEKVVKEYFKNRKFKIPASVIRNDDNYNLGGSHKVAFNYAVENNFDYVIVLHGDDQGDFNDIVELLKSKEYLNYDCMLGSRFMKGSKLGGYSKFRTFGNKIYNIIFSVFLNKRISDLGSGLNMYNVNILKTNFYHKYPDRLTFNCYMLLAASYYKHNIKFFPISWREDDQVSNVKMFSQAMNTLELVFKFFISKEKYLNKEHRTKIFEKYTYKIVNKGSEKNEK